jgi:methionyl-tRNA synthetase
MEEKKAKEKRELTAEEKFRAQVDLRVAKITAVERHPEADKLYIETIDAGEEEPRQIVSGLVPFYKEEELLNRNIILVSNLKPAKLRGVKSNGMLLAADGPGSDGEDAVDVIFADDTEPGTRVYLEGDDPAELPDCGRIKADAFFDIPIKTEGGIVKVGSTPLAADGRKLATEAVKNGRVG